MQEVGVASRDDVSGREHRDRLVLLGHASTSAAHEINGHLTATFHALSEVRRFLVGGLSGEALQRLVAHLGDAEDALDRIHRITQGITTYGRAPSTEIRRFALDEVVTTALRLGSVFLSGTAQVRARLSSHAVIEGRPDAVVQIVVNLLTNAAHSIRSGGGSAVRVDATREDRWAVLRVKDDGPGVPEAIAARIFEPYFTTKSELAGTGLGLAVCRELAAQHGGSVELVDDGERGAVFEVRLPACD
jgi:C4-dicarboxylate-specific signal transduction histidine kinase